MGAAAGGVVERRAGPTSRTSLAVSYTHLDVYKRQHPHCFEHVVLVGSGALVRALDGLEVARGRLLRHWNFRQLGESRLESHARECGSFGRDLRCRRSARILPLFSESALRSFLGSKTAEERRHF